MRRTKIKLIIFVIFTTTVTGALAALIGNYHLLRSQYPLDAKFADATGLLQGDFVTLAGVIVGKVKSTTVEKGYAVVRMTIDKKVQIPRTSRVEIRYRNLIGQRQIVLLPTQKRPPYFKGGDRVPVSQTNGPLDLGLVFNNLRPLVSAIDPEAVNTLSKALVVSFAQHKGDLDAILADTATLTGALAPKEANLASLIANLDSVAGSVADQRTKLQELLKNFSSITTTLANRSSDLDRTLQNLNNAAGNFGHLLADNRPGLDQDIKDLATLLDIVDQHQGDITQIVSALDEVLRASARATSYGEWGNLYIFSLCSGDGDAGAACRSTSTSTSASPLRTRGSLSDLLPPVVGAWR